MSASDNLSSQLFHGTAHAFKPGDVVEPRNHVAAFASTRQGVAEAYASSRAEKAGTLFGLVYDVEPMGTAQQSNLFSDVYTDRSGYRVNKFRGYSIGSAQ